MDDLWTRGEITLYRLFDVGYEIDLGRASDLLVASAPERLRPARGEAQAIRIANPPVTVRLGTDPAPLEGSDREIEISARLFDFGVVSVRARVFPPAPLRWSELSAWGARVHAMPLWTDCFRRWRERLLAQIADSISRPDDPGVAEDYSVYRVNGVEDERGAPLPVSAIGEEHAASLLFGEGRPLTAAARRELMSPRFSFFEDDLALLAWNAALVVEPVPEDRDVEYVLEFANAQLLELRYYDSVLDAEIPRIYGEIAAARRAFHVLGRRYSRLLGQLQTRVADATELIERVENSLKVTDDVFLARIYSAALEVFRAKTWRAGMDRKVAILRDAYSMLDAESQGRRAEVLESTIVVLILVELVLGLMGRR